MKWFTSLALAALLSCSPSTPSEPSWGADIEVKILSRPSDVKEAEKHLKRSIRVIKRRLLLGRFPNSRIELVDSDTLKVRVPGADASNILHAKYAILGGGSLKIFEMADTKVQGAYDPEGPPPVGYRGIQNVGSDKRQALPDYGTWNVNAILIKEEPLIEEDVILDAWPERNPNGAPNDAWHTVLVLSPEVTKSFNEAAHRLSQATPPGMVAIVLDGQVDLTPRITTNVINKELRITGSATEMEARTLAIILLSGTRDVTFGSSTQGSSHFATFETLKYYGKPETKAPQLR